MSARNEQRQRPQIRREIHDLRLRRRLQKIVTQHRHHRDNQKRPRSRPDHSVVTADHQPDNHRPRIMPRPPISQLAQLARLRFDDGENQNRDQRANYDRPNQIHRQNCGDRRAAERASQSHRRHRNRRPQIRTRPPIIRDRANRSPEN